MRQRVDRHHHLWHYNSKDYAWIGDEINSLRRDFTLSDLDAVIGPARVDKTIVVQARQTEEETDWLLSCASEENRIGAVSRYRL